MTDAERLKKIVRDRPKAPEEPCVLGCKIDPEPSWSGAWCRNHARDATFCFQAHDARVRKLEGDIDLVHQWRLIELKLRDTLRAAFVREVAVRLHRERCDFGEGHIQHGCIAKQLPDAAAWVKMMELGSERK